MEIGEIIAINLKRIREERNLSLGQLADMAGVSKVMLSQLEKGASNPTINTIWKITGALGLAYTSLLELPEARIVHVQKDQIHELAENGYHIFSYYSKNENRSFEIYQIEMEPGCVHESVGHSSGSEEYIVMFEGEISLMVSETETVLKKDDGFCFEASVPHTYKNNGKAKAKMVLMIFYD